MILHGDDGGSVTLTQPSSWFMRATCNGGTGELPGDAATIDLAEHEARRIEASRAMPLDRAIENSIRAGHEPDFARRYLLALMTGGEVTASALELVRRRTFLNQGGGQVLIDPDLRPRDRLFRNAWRRQAGGIVVDVTAAKNVFAERLIAAKAEEAKKLTQKLEVAVLAGQDETALEAKYAELINMDLRRLGAQVMAATTPEQLKALWPEPLINASL